MNRRVELPLIEPLYSAYHYQGAGSAILKNNTSISNFYLNRAVRLTCTRKFLSGFTTPEVTVEDSSWDKIPYFVRKICSTQFVRGYANYVIKNLLDDGFYVLFSGVDDYYVKGKSWYRERHFSHDGMITGYDRDNKTYTLYAYDENWIYRKFITPQACFLKGLNAVLHKGQHGSLCGLKPTDEVVPFLPEIACAKIEEYLDSSIGKYPENEEGTVYGIAVQDYVCKYLDRIYHGFIPYERMDRRVFRVIWEHKKVMHRRIVMTENVWGMAPDLGDRYRRLAEEADAARLLYAAYHMRRRDSLLPLIRDRLAKIRTEEENILREFVNRAKEFMKK